jgi:hypothetical protein
MSGNIVSFLNAKNTAVKNITVTPWDPSLLFLLVTTSGAVI